MGKRNPTEWHHELRPPERPDLVLAAVVVKCIKEMSMKLKNGGVTNEAK